MDRFEAKTMMQAPVLTLKNIYRLLTQKDVPIPSYPVWSEKDTRGMSLNSFWHNFFQQTFPENTNLSVFEDPRMSRTLSRLMNRSGGPGLLKEWIDHLMGMICPSRFHQMTEVWIRMMNQHHGRVETLNDRLQIFAQRIIDGNDLNDVETERFLEELISKENNSLQEIPDLYRHAYTLSWFTLCAVLGLRVNEPGFSAFRLRPDVSCKSLYLRFMNQQYVEDTVQFLTTENTASSGPLPEHAYYGQSKALEEAVSFFLNGNEKLAVCGMGGIGKTEFSQQLINRLTKIGLYQRVAYVSYHLSLKNSFLSAFPVLGDHAEISSVRRLLEETEFGKTLLILDQVDQNPVQDPDLRILQEFGCHIIVTTRMDELEGFRSFPLNGLSAEAGTALFLSHHPAARNETKEIHEICSVVSGHPLTIILLARVCRIRYWHVSDLLNQMRSHGLCQLRYVQDGVVLWLSDFFRNLFHMVSLTTEQLKLLRLFSILPEYHWLPDTLIRYAADTVQDREVLADLCQILHDLGLLLRNDSGYAMHPVIAEMVRSIPIRGDEFTELWKILSQDIEVHDSLGCKTFLTSFLRIPEPNTAMIQCLVRLEKSIGTVPFLHLPDEVYDRHFSYLSDHIHTPADDLDYQLGLGLRDIILHSRIDRLGNYLRNVLQILELMKADILTNSLPSLYTLLEYASSGEETEIVRQLFQRLSPTDKRSMEAARWLTSYSVNQLRTDHDPHAALSSLEKADTILSSFALEDRLLLQSDLSYRKGICQLDLDRIPDARESLKVCLDLLIKAGYPEDAAKVMSTRSTYAVVLWLSKAYEASLKEYDSLAEIYQQQRRVPSLEYVMMRNNMALLLVDLSRLNEAEAVIQDVLRLDNELQLTPDIIATHQRNAAHILSLRNKWREAAPYARQAVAMRKKCFGTDSPWTADAEAVSALILYGLGHVSEAEEKIQETCDVLIREWGLDHRHTRNALKIRNIIIPADCLLCKQC